MTTTDPGAKWTEIEHLPEWDEEFYDVYTAKKFGKWVMLKTLKPELKDRPDMQAMLEREFEVRYNLANAHIIMINDLEEVPGLGRCIITDDVYGDSLAKLIATDQVTADIVHKTAHDLADALDYMQSNHIVHQPVNEHNIIFTENVRNLKVINVGFDQKNELEPTDVADDMKAYGRVLNLALNACKEPVDPKLLAVAERCESDNPYRSVAQLQMALMGNSQRTAYIACTAFLAIMVAILILVLIMKP